MSCVAGGAPAFFTGAFAGLDDPNAAVPRYGTVVVGCDGAGFATPGAGAEPGTAREAPFVCPSLAGASFRCIFDWALSAGPDALRFRGGGSDGSFCDPAGRGTGFGDPEVSLATGEGAEDVAGALVSRDERISLSNYASQQTPQKTVAVYSRSWCRTEKS